MPNPDLYDIRFPGDITLRVLLQHPHPLDLTVIFADGSGVHFTYGPDHDNKGKADVTGGADHQVLSHVDPDTDYVRVRPASQRGISSSALSPATDIGIQYYEPGGSRMVIG